MEPLGASEPSGSKRAKLDRILPWIFLAYGVFAVGLEAALTHDEIAIATGLETTVLALIDFLWTGELVALSIALRGLAVLSPFVAYGTSSLFWRDTTPFASDAFWFSLVLGAAIGVPLFALGLFARRASKKPLEKPDTRAMSVLRWIFRGGLALIVVAMRLGDWSSGIPLVYAGAALAIVALVIVLPRRVHIRRHGVGGVLVFLGLAALLVIGVGKFLVGAHMSVSEAAIGAIPAALLVVVGIVVAALRRAKTA